MDEIYHGCAKGYKDGLMFLSKKMKNVLLKPLIFFLKDPYNVINYVKTRSQTAKQKIIGWKSMMNYFNRKKENQNSI